jgi:hypothetical protein
LLAFDEAMFASHSTRLPLIRGGPKLQANMRKGFNGLVAEIANIDVAAGRALRELMIGEMEEGNSCQAEVAKAPPETALRTGCTRSRCC